MVDADCLTTIFNSSKYQTFSSLGAGSSIPSIRKSGLEAVEVPLPHIEIQRKIAKLNELHYEEVSLHRQIDRTKNKLFQNSYKRYFKIKWKKTHSERINNIVWKACDSFRGVLSSGQL